MNKIYYDAKKNIEIVDLSGVKDIKKLEEDFDCILVDITVEMNLKAEKNRIANEIGNIKEKLIQDKIREIAIKELEKEGKL